jgi:hypothetical protein
MSKFRGDRFGVAGFRRPSRALAAATATATASFCVVAGLGASATVPVSSRQVSAAVTAAPTFDNTAYLGSNARAGYDAAETAITPATAASLAEVWSAQSQGNNFVSSQVITSAGVAFWGDDGGYEHATDAATGTQLWSAPLGVLQQDQTPSCLGFTPHGIDGAATVGQIGAEKVVYVADGLANVWALDAATGAVVWETSVAPLVQEIFGAPAVYNGNLYVGVASDSDCPDVTQGKVVELSATSGTLENTFDVVPNGCVGGGVWDTPAIDEASNTVYVATGNTDPANPTSTCTSPEPYAQAIVALNASTLAVEGYWRQPDPAVDDHDFGSTPTLFTATIGGTPTQLVGAVNKNGVFYAFNRATLAADGSVGPAWTYQVSDPGAAPELGNGSIANASFDGTNLYIGGGNLGPCDAQLAALNPATGAPVWQECTDGPIIGGVVTAPGLVVAAAGQYVDVFNSATGARLLQWNDGTPAWYFGAPTISNGWILIPKASGVVYGLTVVPVAVGAEGTDRQLWAQAPQLGAGWQPLGGQIVAPPAVVAPPNPNGATPAQPLFIATAPTRQLWIRSLTAGWEPVGPASAYCLGAPAAVIVGGMLTVACEGTDKALWVNSATMPSSGLPVFASAWTSLGGVLSAGPAVAPVGGTVTFFVTGSSGQVFTRTLAAGYTATPWFCTGQPAAALQASTGTTTFACNAGGTLWESANTGAGWSKAVLAGGALLGGPAVAATSEETEFLAEGTDQAVWPLATLGGWSSLGGVVIGGVGAAGLS